MEERGRRPRRDGLIGVVPDRIHGITELMALGQEPVGGGSPLVLEVRDVAERLRISRSFAYELIASGRLPSIRLGRRVLVPAVRLDEFLQTESTRDG